MSFTRLLLLAVIVSTSIQAHGQVFKRTHARDNEVPPNAALVMLSTQQNRMTYFKKHNMKASLNQLQRDRDSVNTRMVMDFTDNFTFCPVYYFMDTVLEEIIDHRFSGNLLNKDMKPVNTTVLLSGNDSNYIIVLFGLPIKGPRDNTNDSRVNFATGTSKKRLVVYNPDFALVDPPLPNGSNNTWGPSPKQPNEVYTYQSPKFDIYYKPYVRNFNAKLVNFYGVPTSGK